MLIRAEDAENLRALRASPQTPRKLMGVFGFDWMLHFCAQA